MHWVLESPLTYCALGALGLAACLYLFLSLKQEIRAAARKRRGLQSEFARLAAQMQELESSLREDQEQDGAPAPAAPLRPGLNLNARSQVLRMFRRGDSPAQIAAALGLAQREVELMLKVHRITLSLPEESP